MFVGIAELLAIQTATANDVVVETPLQHISRFGIVPEGEDAFGNHHTANGGACLGIATSFTGALGQIVGYVVETFRLQITRQQCTSLITSEKLRPTLGCVPRPPVRYIL